MKTGMWLNSLVTEDEEKNYQDLKRLTTLYGWVLCVCTSMLICMYQPFIKIWMGEESLLGFKYVICFTVYFYSMGINKLINMFKDAAGIWHKDRFRPLTAALVNLGLNLATVNRFGLYGVLLSSVVSIVLVQIPWLLYNLFQEIYPERYRKRYSVGLGVLTVITLAACTLSCMLCRYLAFDGWMALLVNAGISFIIPNLFCLIVYGRDPLLLKSVRQLLAVVRPH